MRDISYFIFPVSQENPIQMKTPNGVDPKKATIETHLNQEGSLGLLAYGDLGLLAWRNYKKKLAQESKLPTHE